MSVETKNNLLNGYKFIDLFAGIGGFRMAFEHFGAECVFSSEWDKHAQQTYESNFGEKPEGDITKLEARDIPEHDILCAGFPCQAFSISGKQLGFEDARGTLFFDVARIAMHHQPKLILLENVKNFSRHDHGKTLETVLHVLDQIGYSAWHKVLNAGDYGVPQNRERIYIVCLRKDLGVEGFDFPEPTYELVKLRDLLLSDEETNQYVIHRKDMVIDERKLPNEDLLHEYPPRPIRIGTINKGGQGDRIYSDLGHAITLSAYGGGNASKTGAYLINGRVRKLAPRECALLQGFPPDFIIPVSDAQAWKQFGNSVPIKVLKHIINKVIKTPGFLAQPTTAAKAKLLSVG